MKVCDEKITGSINTAGLCHIILGIFVIEGQVKRNIICFVIMGKDF